MFESAELGHKIDKETFKREVPKLRAELLDVQYDVLQKREFPVVILVSGVDGSGKGETINLLYSWMDPRHSRRSPSRRRATRSVPAPTCGATGGAAGQGQDRNLRRILVLAADCRPINGQMRRSELDERLDDINRFEAMLVNEGALVLKFWFHLSKDGQKQRLKALEKNPNTAWRVTKESYERLKTYGRLQEVAGHVLRVTNTAHAPWIIVEGTDDEYRSLTVGRIVLDAMKRRLNQEGRQLVPVAPPIVHPIDEKNVLSELNLTRALGKKEYESELARYQSRLSELVRDGRFAGKRSLIVVFEGPDAAGKGGSIRRVAGAMDAVSTRSCRSRHRPRRSATSPTCGASGATCRGPAGSRSSTARGTAAFWSSGSRASAPNPTGCAPMPRSTISSISWSRRGRWSSSSGCTSRPMSS
jgi:polyphosphate kinase 2 (PPK2 family)